MENSGLTGHVSTLTAQTEYRYSESRLSLASLNHPLPLPALPRRERIASAGERVVVGTEFNAHGRAFQTEGLAIHAHEIACVGIGDVFDLIAVNHDHGWIAAALVRITQLDAAATHERRLMLLDGLFQHARE